MTLFDLTADKMIWCCDTKIKNCITFTDFFGISTL